MGDRFDAPWSRLLVLISIFGTLLLLGLPLLALAAGPLPATLAPLIVGGPPALLVGCLLFTVRGYEIAGGELLVHRLLWCTRVSLDGLRAADHDPGALAGSLRLFGNGGLFSFSGWFRSKRLGVYRAYVTDPRRVVILAWAERKIAVSPDRPRAFVAELRRRRGLVRGAAGGRPLSR